MALPKDPRQKMINMMYLVLTALLALNVSSEILNAFKTVDNSISKSNGIITDKNKVIYESFEAKIKDDQTKAKAEVWKPKADKVKQYAADAFAYIENYKLEVKKAAGLSTDGSGKETYKEDDLDAATRLFIEENDGAKGKALYDKLQAFKKQVLDVLNPAEFANNPMLQTQIKKDRDAIEKALPVDLSIPPSVTGMASTGNPVKDWTNSYFHMTPSVAVITLLSKFQSDVKNAEAQMIDYCHNQIGAVKVVYDQFEAIAQASRTYAMPGEEIQITAGVGAFSDAAKPVITIGGQSMPLTGGKAIYKTTASGAGDHNVKVRIEFTKPDGSKAIKEEDVKYTVGTPSGASMFLEKMNVVYLDVENPVTISAGSAGAEKMNVTFSNGSISRIGGDRFNITPTTAGMGKVTINVNGKATPFEVRCKQLPNPTVMVGGVTSGSISAAVFKAQGGMIAKLKDSEFDFPYQVLSYKVGARNPSGIYQEVVVDGSRWSAATQLINSQPPGSVVYFDNIKVKGPGGKTRSIDGTYFSLK